ncbi:MAG TPA: S9 family peptidase [Terriglobales bacterium]|nr:S9 family peptidase [Terriglobales bacterium]
MRKESAGLATASLLLVVAAFAQGLSATSAKEVLSWKSIENVELSPDGQQIIYTIREPDWQQNRFAKSIWVTNVAAGSQPVPLTASDKSEDPRFPGEKGDAPRWSPDGSRIAFLSSREGAPQIWTVDRPGGTPERLTNAAGGVLSFSWSPDSKRIGYIVRNAKKGDFESGRQADKDAGIVVDKWSFVVYKLLNNTTFLQLDQRNELWVVDVAGKKAEPVITDLHVTQFAWSPDGNQIAAVVQTTPGLANQRTDILIHSLDTGKSEVILSGTGGEMSDNTSSYSNPIWSPDGKALAVVYRNLARRWQTKSQLGIYHFDQKQYTPVPGADRFVLYQPRFMWVEPGQMLLENTVHASRRLFSVSLRDGLMTPLGTHDGSESLHSVSRDGKTVAFVRESTSHRPEIFISHAPFSSAKQVTRINDSDQPNLPGFERVHWTSRDGTVVEGWLAKPPSFDPAKKYPLIVFVHGGPGFAVPEAYEMFVEWPYPYRLAASRGYVVLFPNYRGTGSYSDSFSTPDDLAKEPADDVVTGVEFMISKGFVDEERIGIAGHSHGAWLGPLVLVQNPKLFRAASFAEGGLDLISAYGQMPGWLNMNIHDYYYGGSPFDSLQRYIAISPMFHVAGLTTPTLLEFGDQSLAVQGLEFETALWRCGVPSELILYPKTGHNLSRPNQEAEAMERNLDWFDYWLLGRKDAAPSKQQQYERWQSAALKAKSQRESHSCSPSGVQLQLKEGRP